MPTIANDDKRRRARTQVSEVIDINSGKPYRGGTLHDISSSGAAITYSPDADPIDTPLEVGEELKITVGGVTVLPARIARTFDGGYAVRFDWSMNIYKAFI